MSPRILLFSLLTLAVGFALGWTLSSAASPSVERTQAAAVEHGNEGEAIAARLDAVESTLQDLRREVAAASVSRRVAEPDRNTEVPPSLAAAPTQAALDPASARIEAELKSLGERVESLREALANGSIAAKFPSLDLIQRSAVQQDQGRLQQIILNKTSADSLMWLSQEDVLATLGRPDTIFKRGQWGYLFKGDMQGPKRVTLRFVDNYVVAVHVEYDWQEF